MNILHMVMEWNGVEWIALIIPLRFVSLHFVPYQSIIICSRKAFIKLVLFKIPIFHFVQFILIQLNSFKIKYNLEIKETPIKVGWNGVQRNGIYF